MPTGNNLGGGLVEGVLPELATLIAAVDNAAAACPVRSSNKRLEKCPKCSATTRDPCEPVISAEYFAVKGVREILDRAQASQIDRTMVSDFDANPALTPSGAKPATRLGASRVDPGEGEREAVVAYLRKSASILITSDMTEMDNADDRRELETSARAIEAIADDIERGAHTEVTDGR